MASTFRQSSDELEGEKTWIPARAVARQFGVSRRTLARWLASDFLDFPRPIRLNGRLYFQHSKLEVWKAGYGQRGASLSTRREI